MLTRLAASRASRLGSRLRIRPRLPRWRLGIDLWVWFGCHSGGMRIGRDGDDGGREGCAALDAGASALRLGLVLLRPGLGAIGDDGALDGGRLRGANDGRCAAHYSTRQSVSTSSCHGILDIGEEFASYGVMVTLKGGGWTELVR